MTFLRDIMNQFRQIRDTDLFPPTIKPRVNGQTGFKVSFLSHLGCQTPFHCCHSSAFLEQNLRARDPSWLPPSPLPLTSKVGGNTLVLDTYGEEKERHAEKGQAHTPWNRTLNFSCSMTNVGSYCCGHSERAATTSLLHLQVKNGE